MVEGERGREREGAGERDRETEKERGEEGWGSAGGLFMMNWVLIIIIIINFISIALYITIISKRDENQSN